MTYEALPPVVSKSGRVVEIDGGKAYDLAALGNKAQAARYAEEMAKLWPHYQTKAPGGGRGQRAVPRGSMPQKHPQHQPGSCRVAAESVARPVARDGLDFRPGDGAVSPARDSRLAGRGNHSGEVGNG